MRLEISYAFDERDRERERERDQNYIKSLSSYSCFPCKC